MSQRPEGLDDELVADTSLLADALGGWRGMLDAGLPTVVFIAALALTGRDIHRSVAAAVGVGLVIAAWRAVARQSLQQVVSGFLGLLLSAFLALRSGRTTDFFVVGIVQNALWTIGCLLSLLARRPLLGYIVSALRGQPQTWRSDRVLARRYSAVTWLWTLVFGGRVAVTLPLYLAGQVAWLGTAKILLGWPLYALAVYLTYRVVTRPVESVLLEDGH